MKVPLKFKIALSVSPTKLLFAFFLAVMPLTYPPSSFAFSSHVAFVGNQVVDLKWSPVGGGGTFSHYKVLRNGEEITWIENAATSFCRDSGLSKGQSHIYQV
jgi:hypothetical protein